MVLESDMKPLAFEFLELLKTLPNSKKAKKRNGGKAWFCSGHALINDNGEPLCLLLDAGLTLYKQSLGFAEAVNILPYYYEEEQRALLRLVSKVMPDFRLEVILFDDEKNYHRIKP